MKPILVIGSANVDMSMSLERLPARGETVTGGSFTQALGGKGANQAVAARRAGAEVSFAGCLGRDAGGDALWDGLQKGGIDLRWTVRHPSAPTGVAVILHDASGANYLAVAPGANFELLPRDVRQPALDMGQFAMLLLQCEIPVPTLIAAVDAAREAKLPVLFNYAPAVPCDLTRLAHEGTGIIANELEAGVATGMAVSDQATGLAAARKLQERGFCYAIVTLGALGCCYHAADLAFFLPAMDVPAKDTTAAGDTFCGAFAAALARGEPPVAAARFATVAAVLCVQRAGAQSSIPHREQVEELLLKAKLPVTLRSCLTT